MHVRYKAPSIHLLGVVVVGIATDTRAARERVQGESQNVHSLIRDQQLGLFCFGFLLELLHMFRRDQNQVVASQAGRSSCSSELMRGKEMLLIP